MTLEGDAVGRSHSGVMSIANVMLMNSSFLLIVANAPRAGGLDHLESWRHGAFPAKKWCSTGTGKTL